MAAWGKFVRDQVKLGEDITKEQIIKTISHLKQFAPLRNLVTIPAHLVQDQDNDPLEPSEDPFEPDSASILAFLVQTTCYSTRTSNPSSQQCAPSSSTVNKSAKSPSRNRNPVTKKN